jgi:hypothetical protein
MHGIKATAVKQKWFVSNGAASVAWYSGFLKIRKIC